MAKGLITRRGGLIGTKAPSINLVSKSFDQIVFNIKNNEDEVVEIFWEIDDDTPNENNFSLNGGATSSNITVSNLDFNTTYEIYAFAIKSGKSGSVVSVLSVTTDAFAPIEATGGTVSDVNIGGIDYRIHEFTSVGTTTFSVQSIGSNPEVEFLIIGAGGGGGRASQSTGNFSGGGGGAGGVIQNSFMLNSAQNFNIVVGGAGSGSSNNSSRGNNGGNSSCFGFTSFGGGGAGSEFITSGNSGGSGGGGSNGTGGAGTSGQGFSGGTSGGGGAGGSGSNISGNFGGNGGPGLNINFTGSNITIGGGGGGASVARLYCGQANEGSTLSMATGVSNYIFDNVVFASYGTPTGSCPNFSLSGCHASNSSTLVGNVFLGNSSGSLGALNTIFGDPCPGVVKRLWVTLRGVPNSQTLNGAGSFGGGSGRFNTNGLNASANTGGGGGGSVNGNGGSGGSGRIIIRYPLQPTA